MKLKAFLFVTICTALLGALLFAITAQASQQPRLQAPPPGSCEQAMRENTAYRDRIASLERQIDSEQEAAKIAHLRAAIWQDAHTSALQLAGEYRNELAAERDRNYQLARLLQLRPRRKR